MNRRAIVALLLTTTAFAEPPTASPRNVLQAAVAKKNPIGGVLWIENAGTSEVILEGNRTASLTPEPLTADTIFDVASLTKVVATTPAVLQLIESGKLRLDAPISTYLHSFNGSGREAITLRHLLTHTSGLPAGIPREPAWAGYDAAIARAISGARWSGPRFFGLAGTGEGSANTLAKGTSRKPSARRLGSGTLKPERAA